MLNPFISINKSTRHELHDARVRARGLELCKWNISHVKLRALFVVFLSVCSVGQVFRNFFFGRVRTLHSFNGHLWRSANGFFSTKQWSDLVQNLLHPNWFNSPYQQIRLGFRNEKLLFWFQTLLFYRHNSTPFYVLCCCWFFTF